MSEVGWRLIVAWFAGYTPLAVQQELACAAPTYTAAVSTAQHHQHQRSVAMNSCESFTARPRYMKRSAFVSASTHLECVGHVGHAYLVTDFAIFLLLLLLLVVILCNHSAAAGAMDVPD